MHTIFSIEDSLRFGWEKTKTHSFLLFQVLLTLFALNVLYGLSRHDLMGSALGSLVSLIIVAASVVVGIGFIVITLKLTRGEPAAYRDIVPPWPLTWRVFLASVLLGVLIFAGLILLVVPGIYFIVRFSMVRFAILDGAGVMESFEKSSTLTEGHKWELLAFFLLFALVNLVGALLFGVGLLITVPVTMLAYSHIYQMLKEHHHGAHAHTEHMHEGEHHHEHPHPHDHAHEAHDHPHDDNA